MINKEGLPASPELYPPERHESADQELGNLVLREEVMMDEEALSQDSEKQKSVHELARAFYDSFLTNPYRGNMEDRSENATDYRDTLVGFISKHLDLEKIFASHSLEKEIHSQTLSEFGSLLASIDHNSGVHYAPEEVTGLFDAVGSYVFDSDELQRQIHDLEPGDLVGLDRIIMSRIKEITSLDNATVLALIKNASGQWSVMDREHYNQKDNFTPLEIIRQDNPDKVGWNKYRFRSPVYTRNQSSLYTEQLPSGWYTSEWYRDPSYWSAQLRKVLEGTVLSAREELSDSTSTVVLITEGGIFKGTATAGTDLDTDCIISCDDIDRFEQTHQTVRQEFSKQLRALSFSTKEKELHMIFYDRSSQTVFYRSESGEYREMKDLKVREGILEQTIRENEQGVCVTSLHGPTFLKKPDHIKHGSVKILIDIEFGDIKLAPDKS